MFRKVRLMSWGQRRAFIILLLVLMVAVLFWGLSSPARISSHSVLVLDISGDIEEQRGADVLSAFDGKTPVLHDYVDAIDSARSDSKISGLVVKIGPLETGWGKLEEIRAHLVEFRSSGKPSICYLGGDGTGNLEYYLATGCKEVWMVPTAPLLVRGMMAQATFLRGTLDKLKIVPDYYHIAEYKTATNELTEKKFTPAHREEVDSLLHGIYNQYLTDVSGARSLARSDFETLVGQGPFSTDEAVKNHLVDRAAYWDQVQDYFKDRGQGWEPVELGRYREHIGDGMGTVRIAVIRASGLIVSGDSGNSPSGSFIMGGDSVAADLRRARKDPSIKAIVFRIDSGGGSVVASEVIRREVELARDAKTLVVSMSDVAASGRILDRHAGAQNRGRSRHHYRLDRGVDREDECVRAVRDAGAEHRFDSHQRQRQLYFPSNRVLPRRRKRGLKKRCRKLTRTLSTGWPTTGT